jgi:hypothetical protein
VDAAIGDPRIQVSIDRLLTLDRAQAASSSLITFNWKLQPSPSTSTRVPGNFLQGSF